jgi:hypothetical protein
MLTKRTMLKSLAALAGVALVAPLFPREALAVHGPKLKEMIEKGDHAGLAEYYKKEADEARHKADSMKGMASEYLKKYPKGQYSKHCEKMADKYLAEAKDNDALAELHSKAAKGGK